MRLQTSAIDHKHSNHWEPIIDTKHPLQPDYNVYNHCWLYNAGIGCICDVI